MRRINLLFLPLSAFLDPEPEEKEEREPPSDKTGSELYMGSKEWLKVVILCCLALYHAFISIGTFFLNIMNF